MKKDNGWKEPIIYYVIILALMLLVFAFGKAMGVPELQGVFG